VSYFHPTLIGFIVDAREQACGILQVDTPAQRSDARRTRSHGNAGAENHLLHLPCRATETFSARTGLWNAL